MPPPLVDSGESGGSGNAGSGDAGAAGELNGAGGEAPAPDPIEPGGPIPDCRFESPPAIAGRDSRWLGFRAKPSGESEFGEYVVELTPSGPRHLTYLGAVEQDEPGAFSGDGRYYAVTETDQYLPIGLRVYEIIADSPPLEIVMPDDLWWVRWSPNDSRYFSVVGDTLVIGDMAALDERRELALPADFSGAAWSPDGRTISLTLYEEGLHLVDTSQPLLSLLSLPSHGGGDWVWSADGRYIAYRRGNFIGTYDTVQGIEIAVSPPELEGLSFAWYGPSSIGWVTRDDHQTFFVELSTSPPTSTPLSGQSWMGWPSPSSECLLFIGYCEAARAEGACLRALPPDPTQPPVMVGRDDVAAASWAPSSDRVLLFGDTAFGGETWLWDVPTAGGPFLPKNIATDGATVVRVPGWNPGPSAWAGYFTGRADEPSLDHRTRLWRAATDETFELDTSSLRPVLGSWSPDARYYVVTAWDTPNEVPVFVQSIEAAGLGPFWAIEEIVASHTAADPWDVRWQP